MFEPYHQLGGIFGPQKMLVPVLTWFLRVVFLGFLNIYSLVMAIGFST